MNHRSKPSCFSTKDNKSIMMHRDISTYMCVCVNTVPWLGGTVARDANLQFTTFGVDTA